MTSQHLLLVEDATDLAAVVVRELEAVGYQVTHTVNGETALALANQTAFDLVILDWMLPGMDGLDVLRYLRENSPIPVLMLTARDAEIDRVLGLEMGADDYLTKPFSMRELIARVRAMLRRRELIQQTLQADQQPNSEKTILEADRLCLDTNAHSVTVEGELVDLTRTEFGFLYLLLSNPGRVFSRAYLLETVWGENYVDGDRSVDNTVLRLRKKLKTSGDALETVWGVGYRWHR
ncbi:MAG TPA: response regulator transcription factor [Phototrophicaceae bacterium]|nr:response regulator transcription factor [Phototrophicaceae bacterium]